MKHHQHLLLVVVCVLPAVHAFILPAFRLFSSAVHGVHWPLVHTQSSAQQAAYEEVIDRSIVYPAYYANSRFHGYAKGNLCWQAPLELQAAEEAIFASYFPSMKLTGAQSSTLMRSTYTALVRQYCEEEAGPSSSTCSYPERRHILDVGCGTGVSTRQLAREFAASGAVRIEGIDLSPFHLAVAMAHSGSSSSTVTYTHANAESLSSTQFTAGSFDLVSISYVLHELPRDVIDKVLIEAAHLLRPGGVLAIIDLNPVQNDNRSSLSPNPVKSRLYRAVEPHFLDYQFWSQHTTPRLERLGFVCIKDRTDVLPHTRILLAWKSKALPPSRLPQPVGTYEYFVQQQQQGGTAFWYSLLSVGSDVFALGLLTWLVLTFF